MRIYLGIIKEIPADVMRVDDGGAPALCSEYWYIVWTDAHVHSLVRLVYCT